jgi:hypothetical protein
LQEGEKNMKVKCPRCGIKEEMVDGKCSVCDLPLEVQSSLLVKFRSMNPVKKAFILIVGLIIVVLLVVTSNKLKNNEPKSEPDKLILYSGTIDGFLGVNWGDSIETAAQKLSSNGYEIKNIDYLAKTISLKSIVLAGHKTSESDGILYFYSKGFYSGYVFFTASSTNVSQAEFDLLNLLGQKYGNPSPNDQYLFVWESNNKCRISLLMTDFVFLKYDSREFIYDDVDIIKSESEAVKASLENRKKQMIEEKHQQIEEKHQQILDHLKGFEKQF